MLGITWVAGVLKEFYGDSSGILRGFYGDSTGILRNTKGILIAVA